MQYGYPMKNNGKANVLIVDDEEMVRTSIRRVITRNYNIFEADSESTTFEALSGDEIDVVVLDYFIKDTSADKLLPKVLAKYPGILVIVVSGKADTRQAVECVKNGAYDFLVKPFDIEELETCVRNAAAFRQIQNQRDQLINQQLDKYRIVGDSPSAQALRGEIKSLAATDATVLIHGETGTGKELVARQLHYLSHRSSGPFQSVNCAAIPRELAESELFGFKKGSFTGALQDRQGKIQNAHGGTLFLDEIGDMPLELQSRLLRFLDSGEYERIGEERIRKADVRIIAATNVDIEAAIQAGEFRKDLYYRLNVCPICISSLNERRQDIPQLIDYFNLQLSNKHNRRIKEFDESAVQFLKLQDWQGNIRQLKHSVERVVLIFPHNIITRENVESLLSRDRSGESLHNNSKQLERLVNDYERTILVERINEFNGNLGEVSQSLGIHRSTLYRKLETLGIDPHKA